MDPSLFGGTPLDFSDLHGGGPWGCLPAFAPPPTKLEEPSPLTQDVNSDDDLDDTPVIVKVDRIAPDPSAGAGPAPLLTLQSVTSATPSLEELTALARTAAPQPRKRRRVASDERGERPRPARSARRTNAVARTGPSNEPSLWDLVMKNTRPVSSAERRARAAQRAAEAAAEAAEAAPAASAADDLADLFGGPPLAESASSGTAGAPDLFGGEGDSSEALALDESGNLVVEEGGGELLWDEGAGGGETGGLLVTTEDLAADALAELKPFKKAYKWTKGTQWTEEQQKRMYRGIRQFGLDLMLLGAVLPEFTSRQIRDHIRVEERRNPEKFASALKSKLALTTDSFENVHGKIDPSTHFAPTLALPAPGAAVDDAFTDEPGSAAADADIMDLMHAQEEDPLFGGPPATSFGGETSDNEEGCEHEFDETAFL